MDAAPRVDLVLLWHMHQPEYRDLASGEFRMPWAYLHAIKDYSDMAWHLEQHPGMRAVVNFTPVLLDQLADYADQFATGELRDPLLRLLARPARRPLTEAERAFIQRHCSGTGHERMVGPFAAYKELLELFSALAARGAEVPRYLSDQYYDDLLTWHHLAWLGETVRRSSPLATRLMSAGARFTDADRAELFGLVGEVTGAILDRYRKLAAAGTIELATTPDRHPLAPLLVSLRSAREAEPDLHLPLSPEYPGGRERVSAQLRAAIASYRERFGQAPVGLWPAEGALSTAFLELLEPGAWQWVASSELVLMNSLRCGGQPVAPGAAYRPYRLEAVPGGPSLFFRDDRLSDLVGFEYASWNSHDAVANFIARLEAIGAAAPAGETPVVSVVLDGENCWEHYDYNGYYFLEELYRALESHPWIRPATFRACAADREAAPLRRLLAGSWVGGDFATWIGSPDKNRGWDLLCAAKQSFDLVMASGRLDEARRRAALRQLAACEGSDWFWWLSGHNRPLTVANFDELFRAHLANLYRLLDLPPPASLAQSLSHPVPSQKGLKEPA